jgi:hypothetical protein
MKWLIAYTWLMSLLGVAFYAHEFAYMDGQMDQRQADRNKLESCQKTMAGNMYASDEK